MARKLSKDALSQARAELDARYKKERAELQARMERLQAQQQQQVGALAQKAGLLELDIPDEAYAAAFEALKRRFQGGSESTTSPSYSPAPAEVGADAA